MRRILLVVILALSCTMTYAQKEKGVKRPDSYNYLRGIDEFNDGNVDEALSYFKQELQSDPKNGYVYCWLSFIYAYQEEYGRALTAADNAVKYVPKKDKEYVSLSYRNRATIYLALSDTIKALADYDSAIKVEPDNAKVYEERADLYYDLKQYDLSNADYKQIIKLDQGSVMGYMGLGRNLKSQEQWAEAIEQFTYVISLDSSYSSGYSFRAESYIGIEDWSKAADDVISALAIDSDIKAFMLLNEFKDEQAFDIIRVKLKVQMDKNPNDANWSYYLGHIYKNTKRYAKAIEYYKENYQQNADDVTLRLISDCYEELGDDEQALVYIDKAIKLDPKYVYYPVHKAYILERLDRSAEAIALLDSCIQEKPDYSWLYGTRGELKHFAGDLDGAIEDYTTNIILDDEHKHSYVSRGFIYAQLGKTDRAQADYKKVIELEDTPEKYEYAMYAYHGLGDDDKAIAVMDTIINRSKDLQKDYYEAACLYSRMKNKEKALEYLEKAFDEGFNHFNHIRIDYDMDFLRDDDDFKSLVDKYYQQHKDSLSHDDEQGDEGEEITTEIPFTRDRGGTCQVECKINDLPLQFYFDTGAAIVSMSKVEADFMFKNGYLTEKDVVGDRYFGDANGDVNPGTIVNLRQVEFGGLILENVQANVVANQRAPLLLGQTVLSRLGKIEIDNNALLLRITHKAVNP